LVHGERKARILYVKRGPRGRGIPGASRSTHERVKRISTFGIKGLGRRSHADDDQKILPDLEKGEIGLQSAPTVAKDTTLSARIPARVHAEEPCVTKRYVAIRVATARFWIFHRFEKGNTEDIGIKDRRGPHPPPPPREAGHTG